MGVTVNLSVKVGNIFISQNWLLYGLNFSKGLNFKLQHNMGLRGLNIQTKATSEIKIYYEREG